ncbi:uncharacterized protein LOC111125067 isoform X2 [Crassostrea virginica]
MFSCLLLWTAAAPKDGILTKKELGKVFSTKDTDDCKRERSIMQFLIISCFLVFSFGQQPPLTAEEMQYWVKDGFENLDVDPKDGILTQEELGKVFSTGDTDGDGNLTRTDFGAFMGLNFPFTDQLFNLFDWNKNGVLSKDEFVDKPLVAADQNGDNQLSRQEFDDFYTKVLRRFNQQLG